MSPRSLGLGVIFLVCPLSGQSTKIEDLAAGKILVMERQAPDPVFAQSVILLIHYGADGVVGLMLNQPAGLPLSRLHDVNGTANRSDPIYAGGPVEFQAATALVRTASEPPDAIHVAADLYAVQTKRGLEAALKASKGPADLRLYLGYCGWTIPQLKNELALGSWYIFDHGERFVFDSTPSTLWKRLIDRTGGQLVFAPALKPTAFKPVSWNHYGPVSQTGLAVDLPISAHIAPLTKSLNA